MKYFIISQPKAGTYLCSNLLVEFGLHQTGMHCKGSGKFQKYDLTDPYAVSNVKEYTYVLKSFKAVVESIPDNGFAVGHFSPNSKRVAVLNDFKKILVIRPHEDYQGAADRFKNDYNRSLFGLDSNAMYNTIKEWQNEENVFVINFYDMINKNVNKINQLQLFLFDKIVTDSNKAINNALKKDSLTKSSIRK